MKIKLGRCRCGAITYLVEEAGMAWTADMTPLNAQEAVAALLAGRELYRVAGAGTDCPRLSTAKPAALASLSGDPAGRPIVVQSHGCPVRAVRELSTPLVAPEPTPCPKGPENGAQGAARGTPACRATSPRSNDREDVAIAIIQSILGATVLP